MKHINVEIATLKQIAEKVKENPYEEFEFVTLEGHIVRIHPVIND